ncbi:class I SAM-dependent methyltransferase [Aliikangiella coralliicola]|uniref:Methyltransferase domain-containing protein n=1 Tax=Aliikangiella coralliicola TaxID=2592383 RepID=A0A545U7L9_9GAMM|nr:class I SAM-dependent methyltransferase [Aliikangiella coralliicola]TQV85467.1 methyltransferase domain-containing protein [Aliikangiella coralliicola]
MTENAGSLGWDSYWLDTIENGAYQSGSELQKTLATTWNRFFTEQFSVKPEQFNLLDIACGNGVVTANAIEIATNLDTNVNFYCADFSEGAISAIKSQWPTVNASVADARELAFNDKQFDIIVSQFGIEYAGIQGIKEAVRVLSDCGILMFVMHLKGSGIYQECKNNLNIINEFKATEVVPLARNAFAAGYAIVNQTGSQRDFQNADILLAPAVEATKKLLAPASNTTVGKTLVKIFQDIGQMYGKMEQYSSADVLSWFDRVSDELDAYAERQNAMLSAAITDLDIANITEFLNSSSVIIDLFEPLPGQSGQSIGQILCCRKN